MQQNLNAPDRDRSNITFLTAKNTESRLTLSIFIYQ